MIKKEIMNKSYTSYCIVAGIVALILTFFLGWHCKTCPGNSQIIVGTKSDTARTLRQQMPTILKDVPANIEYRYRDRVEYRDTGHIVYLPGDSTYKSPAFTACMDTVDQGDTVNIKYSFPDNNFNLLLYRKPDTLQVITNLKEVMLPRPWYEAPAFIAGGLVLGYVLKGILK